MEITRNSTEGATGKGPAEWFTGDVYIDPVATSAAPHTQFDRILRGTPAQHVHEVTGSSASDHEVMQHATDRGAVIIAADTDFGALLVHGGRTEPSVILVRELLSLPIASRSSEQSWLRRRAERRSASPPACTPTGARSAR